VQSGNGGRAEAIVERTGEWTCGCGQEYRVLAGPADVQLWPRNDNDGYAGEPVAETCLCGARIPRGTIVSALFGALLSR